MLGGERSPEGVRVGIFLLLLFIPSRSGDMVVGSLSGALLLLEEFIELLLDTLNGHGHLLGLLVHLLLLLLHYHLGGLRRVTAHAPFLDVVGVVRILGRRVLFWYGVALRIDVMLSLLRNTTATDGLGILGARRWGKPAWVAASWILFGVASS